jgi:hypothetical protein
MKTVARRISKLEDRFAEWRDQLGHTLDDRVQLMRERRRRRLAAEGREPEEDLPRENSLDGGNRPRSLSERMRYRRLQRLSMEQSG